MRDSTTLARTAERPSAIVCIAYRQLSTMLGIKDPTDRPKLEELMQNQSQSNAVAKTSIADLKLQFIERLSELSEDMTKSLRLCIENMRARFEEWREQKDTMLDMFPLSHLYNWTQREQ